MTEQMDPERFLGRRLSPRRLSTAFSWLCAAAVIPAMGGCGSKPEAPAVIKPTLVGTGTVSGRVTLEGEPGSEQQLPLDAACSTSAKDHDKEMPRFTRNFVTQDGGLADVFVTLVEIPAQPIPANTGPLAITQRGCEYEPYVAACQVGQTIHVVNDDPLTHNIHTLPEVPGNKEVNQSQAAKAKPLDFTYDKPEEFLRFKCDVHPWMFSYVSVVNHPFYAVTGDDGRFEIKGLPDGKYKVKFKHRKAGEKIEQVEIKDGKATVDVVLQAPTA
jgi:plastocyanin